MTINVTHGNVSSLFVGQVNTGGIMITVAGTIAVSGYSGDGGPATGAKLLDPQSLAVSTMGDIFIADVNNNRIRMVSRGLFSVSPPPTPLPISLHRLLLALFVSLLFANYRNRSIPQELSPPLQETANANLMVMTWLRALLTCAFPMG